MCSPPRQEVRAVGRGRAARESELPCQRYKLSAEQPVAARNYTNELLPPHYRTGTPKDVQPDPEHVVEQSHAQRPSGQHRRSSGEPPRRSAHGRSSAQGQGQPLQQRNLGTHRQFTAHRQFGQSADTIESGSGELFARSLCCSETTLLQIVLRVFLSVKSSPAPSPYSSTSPSSHPPPSHLSSKPQIRFFGNRKFIH